MFLHPFTPGTSPCDGACTIEWAQEQFAIPPGTPRPLLVPAGTIVSKMSYAKEGIPYVSQNSYVTVSDETGIGYALSNGRLFFRFDACRNWAVVESHPTGAFDRPWQDNLYLAPTASPSPATTNAGGNFLYLGGASDNNLAVLRTDILVRDDARRVDDGIPPIPLPGGSGLIFIALLLLALFWKKKG